MLRPRDHCYWCHEPLPPLPNEASYVDEIKYYIQDECRDERDENNRRAERLRAGIADGSIDSIPDVVRQAVLDRIKKSGFSRRCPCLYDPDYDFQGYETHSLGGDHHDVDDYDVRNSVEGLRALRRLRQLRPAPATPGAHSRQSSRALG